MTTGITRRIFLQSSTAALAGAAASALASPIRATSQVGDARAIVLVWLPGGLSQNDTFDPKDYTPFRRGMPAHELLGTCPLIPTAAEGIYFGAGLELIAAVMDRGCVIRGLSSPARLGNVHRVAQRAARGDVLPMPTVPPGGGSFRERCRSAVQQIDAGARFVEVNYPFIPYGDIDTHDYGARRTRRLKQEVDRPIADLVGGLDRRGRLEHTLVVVMSEFGRTVAGDDNSLIRDERDYGFHHHFAACSSALMFGGGVPQGVAIGRSADAHPMLPVNTPMALQDIHAMIARGRALHRPERRSII